MLIALVLLLGEVRECPLEENLRRAQVIVYGQIETVLQQPSGGTPGRYRFHIDRRFRGHVLEEAIELPALNDRSYEPRIVAYEPGQSLLLFLARERDGLRPYFRMQSELVERDAAFVKAYRWSAARWRATQLLEGLPELVAFAELPRARQARGWVDLLGSTNAEVARFALERITDEEGLEGLLRAHGVDLGVDCTGDLSAEARLDLLEAALPHLASGQPSVRKAARAATYHLWREREGSLPGAAAAARDRAVSAILARLPELDERCAADALAALAWLESRAAFEPLVARLASPDHAAHPVLWNGLLALRYVEPVRSQRVLDQLAAHPAGTECEASLGQAAAIILNDLHPGTMPEGRAQDDLQRAALFRAWWPAHRLELP